MTGLDLSIETVDDLEAPDNEFIAGFGLAVTLGGLIVTIT